jgi:transposase-like protein
MKFNDRSRPHFNPQQRGQLLKEFARNPGSARDFAARHGIAASTLYRWQRRPELTESVPQIHGPGCLQRTSVPSGRRT